MPPLARAVGIIAGRNYRANCHAPRLPHRGLGALDCQTDIDLWCPNCDHRETRKRECFQRDCQLCKGWDEREVAAALFRLEYRPRRYARRVHAVVSFTPEDYDLKAYKKARTRANDVAKAMGFLGGLSVYHGFRCDFSGDKGDRESYNEPGPHFHFLGWAKWTKPGSKELMAQGVFWKVIGIGFGKATWVRRVRYLLHHATYWRKTHAVTWLGDLSYNALPMMKEERAIWADTFDVCPKCRGTMLRRGVYDPLSRDWVWSTAFPDPPD